MRGLKRLMVYAAAAATPLSAIVALGVPQAQAQTRASTSTRTGTVEICKSGANGMTGRTFHFTITGLQGRTNPVAVTGGGCSSPLTVTAGHQTVTETAAGLPAGDVVSGIWTKPSTDLVSKNLATRRAVINVRAGSKTGNETVVHYINKIRPAQLKVCKIGVNGLAGKSFTFTENNGAPFGVVAGTPTAPRCSGLRTYQPGTNVTVAEEAVANVQVSSITMRGTGTVTSKSLAAQTITVTLRPGITVVTYTNAPVPPPQNGLLEVCKQASDPYVTGSFVFTITDARGATQTQSVRVGQCTPQLTVAAGTATITETQRAPYYLDDVYTIPSGDLVSQNDANGTAKVTVVSSTSAETQVNFVNDTLTNEVKICKTLTANSTALAGQTFTFQVTTVNGTSYENVVAGGAGSTVCQPVTYSNGSVQWLPIGSTVTITEESQPFVVNTSVVVSPSSQDLGSAPPTANLTVGGPAVVTTATFTNQAMSQIEVCKSVTAYAPTNVVFPFTITDNGTTTTVNVKANTCSSPIMVPAGTATVTETQQPNFVLQGVSVAGSGSLVSQSGNSATVSLPFAGDTSVTFTNTVATGVFKVCKAAASANDAATFQLENATWDFTWSYTANGQLVSGSAKGLVVGECSLAQTGIPVIDQNGNPTQITATEVPNPLSTVSGITVSDGTLVSSDNTAQTVTFTLLPNPTNGITQATFVNQAVLP